MRLSEFKGAEALDVVADLIAPVASIAADPEFKELFGGGGDAAGRVRDCLPALLRSHKADLMAIMAAANRCTPEEYEERATLPSLLGDAYALLTDGELLAFFPQLAGTGPRDASGSASGSTGGQEG